MANREALQKILNANYDLDFFHRNVLHPVFRNSLTLASVPEKRNINASEERLVKSVKKYGTVALTDYRELDLYDVELAENVVIERSRVSIGTIIKKYIFGNNAVLVNFHYANQPEKSWRLSFIAKEQQIEEGEIVKGETNPKRYTYILGQNETCRTAAERFAKLSMETEFTIDKLKDSFSVEKLSKTFFDEYKEHYLDFVEHLNKQNFKATVFNGDEKAIRDFAKKLLGRIVFLYFVQKKGWLGASNTKYADGSPNFLEELFIASGKNESFYDVWLKKLFYDTLNNQNRNEDEFKLPDGKIVKIPFLNGGLFEDDDPKGILTFPPKLFADLFEFFKTYNFTIYEDSPDDHTLAVDPEMLGHIFENLLEDNKDKGAYYTPKEIVHYMCQESLIEYLATKLSITETASLQQLRKEQTGMFDRGRKKGQLALTQEHKGKGTGITRAVIEQFIKHNQLTDEIKKHSKEINKYLDEVKICDPAIGSGAFPMGLLHEIFNAKLLLNEETGINPAEVKQNIIQNSIYGVDIENGAVDIARLRFWLSLIVDEDKPRALPNLDYKIVVGDSLLPKFEGEVVDIDWDLRDAVGEAKHYVEKIKSGLKEIVEKQKQFFKTKTNKPKLQTEIRNLKIDLLINQLSFDKLKYSAKNKEQGKLGFTEKTNDEIKKDTEIKLKITDYEQTIKKLDSLKSRTDEPFHFFDWKLDFPEIMNPAIVNENPGFDIVIANPPYVGQKGHKDLFTPFSISSKWKTFYERKQDLYYYFIVTAIDLLNTKGIITYIIPPYFTTAFAGKNLRKYISQKSSIQKILNLSEHLKVFDGVSINNLILFLDKKDKNRKIRIFEPKSSNKITHENVFQNLILIESNYSTFEIGDNPWNLFKTKEDIEINQNGIDILPLGSLATISPGIQTGCDKLTEVHIEKYKLPNQSKGDGIFVISDKEKNNLKFSKDELKLIKPFYKNSAVSKWIYDIENIRWIIITNTIDNLDKYPNIKNHLTRFKKVLDGRYRNFALINADKENKWWFLYGYRPNTNFDEEKIILPYRSEENSFAYSNQPFYSSIDVFFINLSNKEISIKYLNAILCSKLILYWLKKNCKKKGKIFELYQEPLSKIPIKVIDFKFQPPFISIVDKILEAKKTDPAANTTQWEKQIDVMVYKLYQLTYDEVLVVDNEFEKQMNREEYDKLDYSFEYVQPDKTAIANTNGKKKGRSSNFGLLKDLEF